MAAHPERQAADMTPLTRRDVLYHQAHVPWPKLRQVEQDLLLCRSMCALFNDKFLHGQIAMRGGTLLHKVHLAPPARYSEDIDLVVFGNRPEEHIRLAIERVLADVLGRPTQSLWDWVLMALRNASKPSRLLRITYTLQPVSLPGPPLNIKIRGQRHRANAAPRNPGNSVCVPLPRQEHRNPAERLRPPRDAGH